MAGKKGAKKGKKQKKSILNRMRAWTIVGAKALPAARIVALTPGKDGVINAGYNQLGMRPDGSFSKEILKEQWLPVTVVVVGDTILSKTGIYRRVSKVLRNLF